MAKKKNPPIITHTELLCLAAQTLERDIRHWEAACADLPDAEERVGKICARQFLQLGAIRKMYLYETGTEM